jgi:hypothetical protein
MKQAQTGDRLNAEVDRSLMEGLRAALAPFAAWAQAPLLPLPDKGLAHLHIRLQGTGVLARLPKQSQVGLPAHENLLHQQACFERAAPSGHTPRLMGVLAPGPGLPRGALLVEDISGSPAALPRDLDAIARALAAVHALPLPPPPRAPLRDAADPLQDLLEEISVQAAFMDAAGLDAVAARRIQAQLEVLRSAVGRVDRPPRSLIAFDAHPGNFLMRGAQDAVLVDLEKCRYSHAGLDLAHATLYTSTTWEAGSQAVLSPADLVRFYSAWEGAVGDALATRARPWHVVLRRAMWLWSITWCCKWRALSGLPASAAAAGEDWSADHSDPALVRHVRERVGHYLLPKTIERVQDELRDLQGLYPA